VAEAADREQTAQDIERLREAGDRLSRRAASLEKEVAVLTERADQVRLQVNQGFAMIAMEGRLRQITDIVTALQSNAYSERGSVLAISNLLLAANQMFWTLLEPVLKEAGMLSKAGSSSLQLLTPIGAFLTGQLLLANRQHERFLTGISTVDSAGDAAEVLRSRIAESDWADFQRRGEMPTIVYVVNNPGFFAQGSVSDGVLKIKVFPAAKQPKAGVRVAWLVDTGIGHE
jgi:hypothetical protein